MSAGPSASVAALVVAAGALLATCVFGFLSFMPGVDPQLAGFLELAFFGAAVVTMGAAGAYFVTSRRAAGGEPPSQFDRLLVQKSAALGAVPLGLVAVLVGALWFVARKFNTGGGLGVAGPSHPAAESFAAIDSAGIGAFLGFGSLYIIVATYVAIRAERAAVRLARQDVSEVKLS